MSLVDEPSTKIDPPESAPSDDPFIPISVQRLAHDRGTRNLIIKGQCRCLPTPIGLPLPGTELITLGGIDSVETDSFAVDFQSIGIDHAGTANDRFGQCCSG